MLKTNFVSNFKTKATLMTTAMIVAYNAYVYADVQEVAKKGFDTAFTVVAAIPAVMGIINVVNAAIAYSQSQSEGGSAQAAGKMSGNIISAIVCFIIAILAKVALQPLAESLLSIN